MMEESIKEIKQKTFTEIQKRGTGLYLFVFLLASIFMGYWTQRSSSVLLLDTVKKTVLVHSMMLAQKISDEMDMAMKGGGGRGFYVSPDALSYVSVHGKVYSFTPGVSSAAKLNRLKVIGADREVFTVPLLSQDLTVRRDQSKTQVLVYKPVLDNQAFLRWKVPASWILEAAGNLSNGVFVVRPETYAPRIWEPAISFDLDPFPQRIVLTIAPAIFWKRVLLLALAFFALLYGPVVAYKEMVKGLCASIFDDIQNVMYLITSYITMETVANEEREEIEVENVVFQRRMHFKEFAILAKALDAMRSKLKSSMSLLKQKSALDPLTQLPNRSALLNEIDNCIRSGIPFSLLFMDLDGFKKINDELGHEAGDETLRSVSQVLQRMFRRQDDLVCRYGGDEFVVLMLGNVSKDISAISDRVRENIEGIDINKAAGIDSSYQYRVSASIGCAIFPEDSSKAEEVIQIADQRMYQDKTIRKRARNAR